MIHKELLKENLDYPPPYCNGNLHLGHIYEAFLYYIYYNLSDEKTLEKNCSTFTKTILDLLNRKKKEITLNLGVDVNGLPVSLQVQKEAESKNSKLEKEEFKNLCDELIKNNTKKMYDLFKKIKISELRSVKKYSTQDEDFKKFITDAFRTLKLKNLISTARRPQLYCTYCKTFLARTEVEAVDCSAKEAILTFFDQHNNSYQVMSKLPEYVVGIIGLVYNPSDSRYHHLKGKTLKITVRDRTIEVPVYQSKWVHKQLGTGLTFISAWGGQIDFKIINDLNLNVVSSLHDSEGNVKSELREKFKFNHISQIVDFFNPSLRWVNTNTTIKKLLHTERSNCCKQVIYLDSNQVYLEPTLAEKNKLKELLKTVDFEPKSIFNQLLDLIDSYNGWCLSRTNKYHSFEAVVDKKVFKIDTWMISALTPSLNYEDKTTVVRLQGADIIKTWAFYTFFLNSMINRPNVNRLIIHKMIVDAQGAKFSKSRNNAPDLNYLLENYDLKVLRYYLLEKPLEKDIRFNLKEIKDLQKFFTKLKNVNLKIEKDLNAKNVSLEVYEQLQKKVLKNISEIFQNSFEKKQRNEYVNFFKQLKLFFEKDLEFFKFSTLLFKIKSIVYCLSNDLKNNLSQYELVFFKTLLNVIADLLKAYD